MQLQTATSPVPSFREGPSPPRVLLLEVDDAQASLLEAWLRRRGWDVERVRCGRRALARVEERPPAAIVAGLDGEEVGGLDLLLELRRVADAPPVVVCAPGADERIEATLLALGAAAVTGAPEGFARLEEALTAVLGRAQRRAAG